VLHQPLVRAIHKYALPTCYLETKDFLHTTPGNRNHHTKNIKRACTPNTHPLNRT
jgi:hypothetical protein